VARATPRRGGRFFKEDAMNHPAVRTTTIVAGAIFFLAFVAIFAVAAKSTNSLEPLAFALVPVPLPFLLARLTNAKPAPATDFKRLS
jgi:hypothetical protein